MKKKIFSIFITVVAFVLALSFTNSVKAATTVEDITNADTLHQVGGKPTVKITGTTVTYNAAALKIIGGEDSNTASAGRPDGYAWLGIRISAPDTATHYKIGEKNPEKLGTTPTSTPTSFDQYFGVNEENLKNAVLNGKDVTFTLNVTWLKDDGNTEVSSDTIKVIVKADKVTLYDKDNNNPVWDETIADAIKAESKNTELDASNTEEITADKKDEKDNTYKTGSANIVLGSFVVSIISLAGIYFIKK